MKHFSFFLFLMAFSLRAEGSTTPSQENSHLTRFQETCKCSDGDFSNMSDADIRAAIETCQANRKKIDLERLLFFVFVNI